jgi:hypothetical protein
MTFSMPNSARLLHRPAAALIEAFQRRWTCPIGVIIAGRVQTVHSAQRGRAKGIRPPDGVDEP